MWTHRHDQPPLSLTSPYTFDSSVRNMMSASVNSISPLISAIFLAGIGSSSSRQYAGQQGCPAAVLDTPAPTTRRYISLSLSLSIYIYIYICTHIMIIYIYIYIYMSEEDPRLQRAPPKTCAFPASSAPYLSRRRHTHTPQAPDLPTQGSRSSRLRESSQMPRPISIAHGWHTPHIGGTRPTSPSRRKLLGDLGPDLGRDPSGDQV